MKGERERERDEENKEEATARQPRVCQNEGHLKGKEKTKGQKKCWGK